jgi:hypothetical protein
VCARRNVYCAGRNTLAPKGGVGDEGHGYDIPIQNGPQHVKSAFNDPMSAPGVTENGGSDAAGYVKDGGLADITEEFDILHRGSDAFNGRLPSGKDQGRIDHAQTRPDGAERRRAPDSLGRAFRQQEFGRHVPNGLLPTVSMVLVSGLSRFSRRRP